MSPPVIPGLGGTRGLGVIQGVVDGLSMDPRRSHGDLAGSGIYEKRVQFGQPLLGGARPPFALSMLPSGIVTLGRATSLSRMSRSPTLSLICFTFLSNLSESTREDDGVTRYLRLAVVATFGGHQHHFIPLLATVQVTRTSPGFPDPPWIPEEGKRRRSRGSPAMFHVKRRRERRSEERLLGWDAVAPGESIRAREGLPEDLIAEFGPHPLHRLQPQ